MCQESVSLSGTPCLELVDSVLIRQLLSENGSLSHLKLFVGEEQFQWTGLKNPQLYWNMLSEVFEMSSCGVSSLMVPIGFPMTVGEQKVPCSSSS